MTDEQWEAELVAAHLDAAEQEKRRRAAEAEVERLRAQMQQLEEMRSQEHDYAGADAETAAKRIRDLIAQNAAMRELVTAVAAMPSTRIDFEDVQAKARDLLASE